MTVNKYLKLFFRGLLPPFGYCEHKSCKLLAIFYRNLIFSNSNLLNKLLKLNICFLLKLGYFKVVKSKKKPTNL